MEMILAIVIFGILAAICIYGFRQSSRASTERARDDYGHGSTMAAVSGRDEQRNSPSN